LFAIRDYFLFLFFFFSFFLLGGVAYDTGLVGDQFFQPRLFFGSGGGGGLFQRRFGLCSSLFSLKTKSFLSLVFSMLYPFSMDSTSADLRFVQFRFKPSGNSLRSPHRPVSSGDIHTSHHLFHPAHAASAHPRHFNYPLKQHEKTQH
jgi:hypothetical protein